MAKSRRGCALVQQSMRSSNPLACTSRFSAVVAELLISRYAPLQQIPFLGTKVRLIPKNYREYHRFSCKKARICEHHLLPVKNGQIKLRSSSRTRCSSVTMFLQALNSLAPGLDNQPGQ